MWELVYVQDEGTDVSKSKGIQPSGRLGVGGRNGRIISREMLQVS